MFCGSGSPDEDKRKSKEIDSALKKERVKRSLVQQLLLLGTGESGKSTIIKQMKILHINGFSEKEKKEHIVNIRQNIHESIYTLVTNMSIISPPVVFKNEDSKTSAQYILHLGEKEPEEYSDEYYDHVKVLWKDAGIQETFKRSNEFQLIDSAKHFLDRIDDIRQSSYSPTVQDMLFCRIMTMAISKIEFKIPYKGQNVEFWMYDVGGQRGERKKWISVFEGIHAILFLIAASDFDLTLREDTTKNRLEEAFLIFSDIFWSRFVRQSGKIVFLNKQDLLQQKIENGHRLEKYFTEFAKYTPAGNKQVTEYERAKFYMRDKIIQITETKPATETVDWIPGETVKVDVELQNIYIHFTVATDTENVKKVFDSVKDMVLKDNLGKLGIY